MATIDGPWQLREAFSTGLFPLKIIQLPADQTPPPQGTFEWVMKQEGLGGHISGSVYTDGSRIHDVHPDTMRLGWAFVVLDRHNHVVAIARGVPPEHVRDIPGAEAWALLQATSIALAGSTFKSDCKPCVDAIHAGRSWACDARRPLARIFKQMYIHIDDVPTSNFTWMPSHTSMAKVGHTRLGNGQLLSHTDRRANMLADDQAKTAAATYATTEELRTDLHRHNMIVKDTARWIGHATWAANNHNPAGRRDSDASRAAAIRCRKLNHPTRHSRHSNRAPRNNAKHTGTLPTAEKAQVWAQKARSNAAADDQTFVRHNLMRSGNVIWCNTCGSFGALRGRGLTRSCPGPAPVNTEGGRTQQLKRLREGYHPKDRYRLPTAIPQSMWSTDDARKYEFLARFQPHAAGSPDDSPNHTTGNVDPQGQARVTHARSRSPRPTTRTNRCSTDIDTDTEELSKTPFGRLRLRTRKRERDNRAETTTQQGLKPPETSTIRWQNTRDPRQPHASERHRKLAQALIAAATDDHPQQLKRQTPTSPHMDLKRARLKSDEDEEACDITQELCAIIDAHGMDSEPEDSNSVTTTTQGAPASSATDREESGQTGLGTPQLSSQTREAETNASEALSPFLGMGSRPSGLQQLTFGDRLNQSPDRGDGDAEPVIPPQSHQAIPASGSKIKLARCDAAGNAFCELREGSYHRRGGVMSDSTAQDQSTATRAYTVPWYDLVGTCGHNPLKRRPPEPHIPGGSRKRARFVEPEPTYSATTTPRDHDHHFGAHRAAHTATPSG